MQKCWSVFEQVCRFRFNLLYDVAAHEPLYIGELASTPQRLATAPGGSSLGQGMSPDGYMWRPKTSIKCDDATAYSIIFSIFSHRVSQGNTATGMCTKLSGSTCVCGQYIPAAQPSMIIIITIISHPTSQAWSSLAIPPAPPHRLRLPDNPITLRTNHDATNIPMKRPCFCRSKAVLGAASRRGFGMRQGHSTDCTQILHVE